MYSLVLLRFAEITVIVSETTERVKNLGEIERQIEDRDYMHIQTKDFALAPTQIVHYIGLKV